jgi:hypothetical protein
MDVNYMLGFVWNTLIKDGNGYPLPTCPRVKNPMGTGLGLSVYPWMRIWV